MSLLSFKGNLGSRCTATLITPRLLIAAAHCITEAPDFDRQVFPGNDERNGAAPACWRSRPWSTTSATAPPPGQRLRHHRAREAAVDTAHAPQPRPGGERRGQDRALRRLRPVGRGQPGQRGRQAADMAPLATVSRLLLTVGPNAHIVCKGDSGGPLLIDNGRARPSSASARSWTPPPAGTTPGTSAWTPNSPGSRADPEVRPRHGAGRGWRYQRRRRPVRLTRRRCARSAHAPTHTRARCSDAAAWHVAADAPSAGRRPSGRRARAREHPATATDNDERHERWRGPPWL